MQNARLFAHGNGLSQPNSLLKMARIIGANVRLIFPPMILLLYIAAIPKLYPALNR